MKIATTKRETLMFHGNCKDDRIKKSLEYVENTKGIIKGARACIFDVRTKKYIAAIENKKSERIRITPSL